MALKRLLLEADDFKGGKIAGSIGFSDYFFDSLNKKYGNVRKKKETLL